MRIVQLYEGKELIHIFLKELQNKIEALFLKDVNLFESFSQDYINCQARTEYMIGKGKLLGVKDQKLQVFQRGYAAHFLDQISVPE